MITSEQVLRAGFSTTQFREGYDERDVDEFLDTVVDALHVLEAGTGAAGLSAADVRAKTFTTTSMRRGYDQGEVDAILAEIAATLDAHEGGTYVAPQPPVPEAPREGLGARLLRTLRGDPR